MWVLWTSKNSIDMIENDESEKLFENNKMSWIEIINLINKKLKESFINIKHKVIN